METKKIYFEDLDTVAQEAILDLIASIVKSKIQKKTELPCEPSPADSLTGQE